MSLLVLAYLRKGETFAELAAGFGVGTATAWRYVTETVALLAARSPKLRRALRDARKAGHAYLVIDGTVIPVDRVAADRPFYSGKHRKHGMNLQVIASPDGDVVWVSGPLPGAVHDLTAARIWGIIAELAASGLVVLADKGYTGAGDHVRVPYKGTNKPASQKDANRAHARLRGPGERADAQLKSWRILRKLRCCPWRAGQLAKAIHVLQSREIGGKDSLYLQVWGISRERARRSPGHPCWNDSTRTLARCLPGHGTRPAPSAASASTQSTSCSGSATTTPRTAILYWHPQVSPRRASGHGLRNTAASPAGHLTGHFRSRRTSGSSWIERMSKPAAGSISPSARRTCCWR
jgi:DDE superfamily endonuclease/Helix-turn-helix of DDE superfamily endonuclease